MSLRRIKAIVPRIRRASVTRLAIDILIVQPAIALSAVRRREVNRKKNHLERDTEELKSNHVLLFAFWGLGDYTIQLRLIRELGIDENNQVTVVGRSEFKEVAHALQVKVTYIAISVPFGDHKAESGSTFSLWLQACRTINSIIPDQIFVSRDDPRELLLAISCRVREIHGFRPLRFRGRVTSYGPSPGSSTRSVYSDLERLFSHIASELGQNARSQRVQIAAPGYHGEPKLIERNALRIVIATQAGSELRSLRNYDVSAVISASTSREKFTILTGPNLDEFQFGQTFESPARSVELIGPTSVPELIKIIESCDILVTADSAPMHIGAFFSKPIVAIFGPGSVTRFAPPGPNVKILAKTPMKCRPCFDKCLFKSQRCWPKDVGDQIRTALDEFSRPDS